MNNQSHYFSQILLVIDPSASVTQSTLTGNRTCSLSCCLVTHIFYSEELGNKNESAVKKGKMIILAVRFDLNVSRTIMGC